MEQILLRKYQQAMTQLTGALDLAFQKTAELEIATVRIAAFEAQLKEKESESSQSKDGAIRGSNEHSKSNGNRKTKTTRSRRAPVSK